MATLTAGDWVSLVGGLASAVVFLQDRAKYFAEREEERDRRQRADVAAQVTAMRKEREALSDIVQESRAANSAAQKESREITLTSMAENREWLAADRHSSEKRQAAALTENRAALAAAASAQAAALAAAASENRAALADDRRAYDHKLSILVESQAKSWWKS